MREMVAFIGVGLALMGCSGSVTQPDDPLGAPVRTYPDEPGDPGATGTQPSDPGPSDPSSPSDPASPSAPSDPAAPSPSQPTQPTGGCTSVTVMPGVMEQESTASDDIEWLDIDDARAADGQAASINFASYQGYDFSAMLYARDFGLALPKNAQIKGITVEIMRKTASAQMKDLIIYLAELGAPGSGAKGMAVQEQYGDDRAKQGYWPSGSYSTAKYGSSTDLWGATLDASKLNSSAFGIAWSIRNGSGAATASVDVMKLTVDYCY